MRGETRRAEHHEIPDQARHQGRCCRRSERVTHEGEAQHVLDVGNRVPARASKERVALAGQHGGHGRGPRGECGWAVSASRPTTKTRPRESVSTSTSAWYSRDRLALVITSSGGPTLTPPPATYMTRSVTASIGLMSWVTSTTVKPYSARRSATNWLTSCWLRRSRLASGSSSSSSCGRATSAWASCRRCCSPPDKRPTARLPRWAAPTDASASDTSSAFSRLFRGV